MMIRSLTLLKVAMEIKCQHIRSKSILTQITQHRDQSLEVTYQQFTYLEKKVYLLCRKQKRDINLDQKSRPALTNCELPSTTKHIFLIYFHVNTLK